MKYLLTLVFFTLFACIDKHSSTGSSKNENTTNTVNIETKEIIVFDSTFVNKSTEFQVIAGRDRKHNVYTHIIRSKSDTITVTGAAGGIEIKDFNSDGFPDVILFYLSNHPVHDLYLFEPLKEIYKEVEGFNQVSDAKLILKQPDIYYAYQGSGCADANWTSTLFRIQSFKVQEIGEIEAFDCEGMEEKKGITSYRIVTPDNLIEVDHFSIDTINSYEDYKRGFIADYWTSNLTKFLK